MWMCILIYESFATSSHRADQNQPIANRSGGSHQKVISAVPSSGAVITQWMKCNRASLKRKGRLMGGFWIAPRWECWHSGDLMIYVWVHLYYALRASSKEKERNYLRAPSTFEPLLIWREMNNRLPMYFRIIIQMSIPQGRCNLASGVGCDHESTKYFVLVVKTLLHLLGIYYVF